VPKQWHAVLVSEVGAPDELALCGYRWSGPLSGPWNPATMAKCRDCHYEVRRLMNEDLAQGTA